MGAAARPHTRHAAARLRPRSREGAAGAHGPRPSGRGSVVAAAVEWRGLVALALGLSLELDAIGVVDDAIEDGVGDRRFADHGWPLLHRDLTGDEDGLAPVARLHDLQQVAPALGGEALQPPVVEHQQGDPAQAAHQAVERAFIAGADERRDQLGDAAIEDGLVLAAGLVGERAGDECLSRPGWPTQDQIVALADPVAGGELGERGPGDATSCAAVDVLEKRLSGGDKALVGNAGYRRHLRRTGRGKAFEIDAGKLAEEARFDGIFVLRTNATMTPLNAVLRYRELLLVEDLFGRAKVQLRTRPIYHSCDAAIRGHVFCSFLALVLQKELADLCRAADVTVEWDDLIRDLDRLQEATIEKDGKRVTTRTHVEGQVGRVFQAAGVALPSNWREHPA